MLLDCAGNQPAAFRGANKIIGEEMQNSVAGNDNPNPSADLKRQPHLHGIPYPI